LVALIDQLQPKCDRDIRRTFLVLKINSRLE
jgi:hypothetical protein